MGGVDRKWAELGEWGLEDEPVPTLMELVLGRLADTL